MTCEPTELWETVISYAWLLKRLTDKKKTLITKVQLIAQTRQTIHESEMVISKVWLFESCNTKLNSIIAIIKSSHEFALCNNNNDNNNDNNNNKMF